MLRDIGGGIEVNTDEVSYMQRLGDVTIVKMKNGDTVASRDGPESDRDGFNLGENLMLDAFRQSIKDNPAFNMARPMGLAMPKK